MSHTAKESTADLYYDDDLYAQIKNIAGEDVEIRLAEVPLATMAKYAHDFFPLSLFLWQSKH